MLQATLPPQSNRSVIVTTKYPLHIFYKVNQQEPEPKLQEYCQ